MVISIINVKGGVGKTATALNLGYLIAQQGHPVTFVDIDWQHDLSTFHQVLPQAQWLQKVPETKPQGYTLIDCPPRSDEEEVVRAIRASDYLIVPLQTGKSELQGLLRLRRDVPLIAGRDVPIRVLITMYSPSFAEQRREIEDYAGDMMCGIIPNVLDMRRAQNESQPIITYKPRSKGSTAYRALAKDVLRWD